MTASGAADDGGGWALWRQDDNGNRFRIARFARFATKAGAEAEQRRFDALAHKQIYRVEGRDGKEGG